MAAKKKYDLTKKEALDLYFKMVLTRKTEDKHEELFQKQMVPVYTHLGTGQEAVGCGVTALLEKGDFSIGTHRGVAEFIGKGLSVADIFLEYGGRGTSISGGKAGLHLHSPELNILPLAGSLGSDFSLAVGAGLTIRNKLKRGEKGWQRVAVDYFGEGAAEAPDFHGAMNMAALWKLPVIFACATNQFVEYHPYRDTTSTADIAPRAEGYGMAWQIVEDGNDFMAVGKGMKEAIDHARSGKGPYFIEFKTYRIAPHHTGDPCVYRNSADVDEAWKNCPILRAEDTLIKNKWATKKDLDKLAAKADAIIEDAVQTLVNAPMPQAAQALEGVYA